MVAHNAQHMLHGEYDPNHMGTIQDYRHIETRKGLIDSKELPTYILLMSHVQTLQKNDTEHLINEQAGFRSGKSCTSQLLNLTQHIEDGYKEGMITGTAFVVLSAVYDMVNHRLLTANYVELSRTFCQIYDSMWS